MKNSLIVIGTVLMWAAHGGTTHAQPPAQRDPALACAQACLEVLGPACQDTPRIVECVVQQRSCSHQALQTMSEEDRIELLGRAVQHFTARTECANPNARRRRQRAEPAPAPAPPATEPRPRRRRQPSPRPPTTVAATREERLAEARRLARTAVEPVGDATRSEIEALQERVDQIPELRAEIEALRAELAAVQADSDYVDRLISERVERWARYLLIQDARARCEPGFDWVSFEIDGYEERVSCLSGQVSEDAEVAPTTEEGEGSRASRSLGRRQRDSRFGLIAEMTFATSRYQTVAHAGSRSPMSFTFGLGLTLRLIPHLYLAGVVDAGVGLRDGEHVPAQAQAHYRVGLLGVVARHLLLGASAQFSHRYSGSGELREQNGTWYQVRHRLLRLEVGYLWRERGFSPFLSAFVGLGVGCHADRRLDVGEDCRFDPMVGVVLGAINLNR